MEEEPKPKIDNQAEGLKFLERDFNQCFSQMRHYDAQIWEICKFAFTGYTALLGVAIGLYQYSQDKNINLLPAILAALSVGLTLGLFMYCLTIRNRVYFVSMARYINEQRGHFMKHKPFGFENRSGMFTEFSEPPFWNWRSSQSWLSYIIAVLNAVLFVALMLFWRQWYGYPAGWAFLGALLVVFLGAELLAAVLYLRSRESKSLSRAVFGKRQSLN